jgi:hypothetical protein
MFSLEYTEIPKMLFHHITGDDVSRSAKPTANATMLSEATV